MNPERGMFEVKATRSKATEAMPKQTTNQVWTICAFTGAPAAKLGDSGRANYLSSAGQPGNRATASRFLDQLVGRMN